MSDMPRGLVVGAILIVGMAACGSSGTASKSAASTPGLQKPADAGKAFSDAIAPAASFADLRFDQVNSITAGKQVDTFSGSITATRNPPRVETRSAPVGKAGASLDSIQDYAAGTLCILQPEPRQRLTGQSRDTTEISPFFELTKSTAGWTYLSDINTNGQVHWRVTSKFTRQVPGDTLPGTAEVEIDAHTGRVVKSTTTVHSKKDSVTFLSVSTFTNFVYNNGATVAAC